MIDTKAIRVQILRLAFSAQLTTHHDDDDDVSSLLSSINSKKNIEQTEDIPYEIPDYWKWVKLSDLYEINPKVEADNNADAAFIPMEKISAGFERTFSFEVMNWEKAAKNHTKFQDGDVAFAKISPCFENRKSFVAENLPNSIGGGTTELIVLRQKYVYPLYTYYLVNDQRFIKAGSGSYKGIVGQQRVKSDVVKDYLIPLPPLAEQKRIVERVEEIFRLLDTIDKAQEKYSADSQILKAKLITAGIQGKLTKQLESDGTAHELYQQIKEEKDNIIKERQGRKDNSINPVEDDVPYEIPVNWKWIRFGETGFFRKGPFGSSLTKSMFVPKSDDSIKVYEQQHAIKKDHTLGTYYITKEYFDESMKGFEVLPDDIIISCAGTIGETFIMPDNIEKGIINQALMRVTVVPSIDKQFFLYYFNSQLKESAKEGNGSAITNIPPFDVLKNLYFPLPPLAEQKRIADVLERVLGVVE